MTLLAPWFLAGLAALAVPVAVHLINRRRKTVVAFPSLMFLQRVPYKSVRRQQLRHLMLFALRCLVLALLAAAFARPFLKRGATAAAVGGARERIVLLDRSYSMSYGARWDSAQRAARRAIADIGGNDRATIVLFGNEATAVTEPTANRAALERAIASAQPGDEATRYGPALSLAGGILEGSNLPRHEVVLISDFQRNGWLRRDDVRLPTGTVMRTVDVASGDAIDLAVSHVIADRARDAQRQTVTIAARLTNTGNEPRAVDATLEIGGRLAGTRRATVPARGTVQVRFGAVAIPSGATRGVVRIPRDGLAANNAFYFTVARDDAVSVLIVESPLARAHQSFFIERALGVGDEPSFHVDVRRANLLTTADLAGRAFVVLNEVAPPTGAIGARLRSFVEAGGGLFVVAGDVRGERWPTEWQGVLPVRVGATIDRSGDGGGSVATVDYSHPAFEQFAAPRSGDFSTARVFRYRLFTPANSAKIIARFDDGAPAAVEQVVGQGHVIAWASTLDAYWTDLPMQPVFLPFVHELARHLARYRDARGAFVVGEPLDLSRHGELTAMFAANGAATEFVLQSPSGKRTLLPANGAQRVTDLREAGLYELRTPGIAVGSGRPVAVNVDLAESDLSRFDPLELVAAVTAPRTTGSTSGGGSLSVPEDEERRQAIWWYLLMAALLVAGAESVVSNRLSLRGTR